MTKVAKIKLNRAGVRRLLKSKEMQAICTEHAEEIAARCGEGYAVDSMQKETRAIATVYPQTAEARRDNYRNNTIEKALRCSKRLFWIICATGWVFL